MVTSFTPSRVDLDAFLASAPHVVECTIEQNRYVALPMETRGILASWASGREEMTLVCSTQSVHAAREFFARYLAIPEARIRVTARDVGGGFGQKMFVFREECAVVLASRLLTAWYFLHFIVVLPLLGLVEKPKPLPNSISEAVLGHTKAIAATAVFLAGAALMLGTPTPASAQEHEQPIPPANKWSGESATLAKASRNLSCERSTSTVLSPAV